MEEIDKKKNALEGVGVKIGRFGGFEGRGRIIPTEFGALCWKL